MTDKTPLSEEDEKLLDFQHKRTYNQYLHERDVINSLKNTDAFRMTVMGVISSVWLATFLPLVSSTQELAFNLKEFRIILLLIFIITLGSLYLPHILSHFKSVSISERFVVNDRRHLMDDFPQKSKTVLQEKDMQLWRIRLNQTGGFISQTTYRLRKTELSYYLFITSSIFSIPLLAYASLIPERQASTTYLLMLSVLFLLVFLFSSKANIDITRRKLRKPRSLTYTITDCQVSNNNWSLSIEGATSPRCRYLSLWLCTTDTLIGHRLIPVDKKGKFNKTISGRYDEKIADGTICFGILSMPENGKRPNVRLIEKRRGTYIANIISIFGQIDEISAIPIYSNYKTENLPLRICSLLDDAGETEYGKYTIKSGS